MESIEELKAEIARLYRIAFERTGDEERAQLCVKAYLAGLNGFLPKRITRPARTLFD